MTTATSTVVIYPEPEDVPCSAEYTAHIDDIPLHVHAAKGFAGGTAAWLSFDTPGPVDVRLKVTRYIDEVSLIPAPTGSSAEIIDDGYGLSITVPGPGQFFVKTNGTLELPLYIFANPLETDAPPPPQDSGADLLYFGPGVHKPGRIDLTTGQTLYLAAGAFVHGNVYAENADNIAIRGRGILYCGDIAFGSELAKERLPRVAGNPMVVFKNCKNTLIEGITLFDAVTWNVLLWHCEHARVDNLKIVSERGWSTDGINPVDSRDVIIENCFARCKDDCISIKGHGQRGKPDTWITTSDIVIRNCVFWSENNNALVVGAPTRAKSIERVHFHDITLIKVSNTCGDDAAAMSVYVLDDCEIEDILFERILVHHCTAPLFNVFFRNKLFRIEGTRLPRGGSIRQVAFRDITLEQGPSRRSYIDGLDENHTIENVLFENVVVRGKRIRNAGDLRLIVKHGSDIRFE